MFWGYGPNSCKFQKVSATTLSYNECPTQSANVWDLLSERAPQDNSNNTPQQIWDFLVDFPLLWLLANPGLSHLSVKGSHLETRI